ncbi:Fur family transcriptional regulator [Zooshikella sp. RANM57]|uniref:Fur family transcriptional regulator n=1 Tax=Zooshikella sp. RANM57 TaxID=3425863 RepID=UPI003D6EE9C8
MNTKNPTALMPHNHASCIAHALDKAQTLCQRNKVRLTELRLRVLELVWHSHKPLGAYDILAVLAKEDGRNAAPPTVYRALDFLLEQGLIHRIASLNAFIGCSDPECPHQGYFLICNQCGITLELHSDKVSKSIHQVACEYDFEISHEMVEVVGVCPNCQA